MSSDLGEEHGQDPDTGEPPMADGTMEQRHHRALHERLSALESELSKGVKHGGCADEGGCGSCSNPTGPGGGCGTCGAGGCGTCG